MIDYALAPRASRVQRILAELAGVSVTEALRRIDSDAEWFRVWTSALGMGARCPSQDTRWLVRENVRAKLPPLAEVFREQLQEIERTREQLQQEELRQELRRAGMEVWKP